ncbi:Protein NLRC3 [Phytophthora ramorum]|uniref:Protein NLRC3 n=1 Tax=Phytophthora ramorum TaxID=164328 RepID=UPI00309E2BC7|nr:Protein NLRC3 [Phytophthora ramorum]
MAARGAVTSTVTQLTTVSQVQDAARVLMQTQSSRRSSKVPALQGPKKILLVEQQLDSEFGAELFPLVAFPAVSASLTVLDLSFNELDDRFWMNWTTELHGAVWPGLVSLNLANNQFSARGLKAVAAFIARCPSLTQLDVSLNLFGEPNSSSDWIQPLIRAFDAKNREPLQILDMSCTGVTDACFSQLMEAEFSKYIAKLYLRSNALTDKGAITLGHALPLMKLEVLSLSGNLIGDCGAASLAFVLDQAPALQTLDLEQNQIGQAGIMSFYHAINGMVAPFPVRYLHLGRNTFASEPVLRQVHRKLHEKIIETQLNAGAPVATALNLSGSKVKRDILLECCLTDQYVHIVLATLRSSPNWQLLEVLDLNGNEIGEKGTHDVGLFLALQPPLRVLNLSNNLITDTAILGLAEGLELNVRLQELLLDHNQITDAGAKQLYLKAFKANQQRRIRLSAGNPLTSECKVMLAAISQAHDLRKRFGKELAPLETLDLSGKALRQYGAAAIAEELAAAPSSKCRCLDFSRNSLGDEGAQAVAKLIRAYPRLEDLDVSFNDIGDEGAIALADALADNSTLVSFSLHSVVEGSQAKPKLQEKGLCHLARAIQKHSTLVKVDLRDNATSPAVVRAYVEMLRRNQGIQKFNGTNAAVFLARYDQ